MGSKNCYLRSLTKLPTQKINLPHNKSVIIGRNRETGITDLHVSRNQLELKADLENSKVLVTTTSNLCYSGCNGFALLKNETYQLKNSDIIEVRLGFYPYEIVFEETEQNTSIAKNEDKNQEQNNKFDLVLGKRLSTNDDSHEKPAKKARIEKKDQSEDNYDLKERWEEIDDKKLFIYTTSNCKPQSKIAGFDVDGTIIKTKSGKRFPENSNDWTLNLNSVTPKLKELHDQNYKIVLFSNQSKLSKETNDYIKNFKIKIENIAKKLAVPLQVFLATGYTIYRKPSLGMWDSLIKMKNGGIEVSINDSFYVGDAAGRPKNWTVKRNKDHSVCDRLFALNIGLKFYTPEEYFLKSSKAPFEMPVFDPRNLPTIKYPDMNFPDRDVILMVGGPGSGKTHYCKTQLIPKNYIYISRDELSTWQKCCQLLEDNIQKKNNIVIDNTNPDAESRKKYLNICKNLNVNCRCFVMKTEFKHAMHNNTFRKFTDDTHQIINDIVMHSYKKKYEEPQISEGFSEIVHIPFVPKFDKEEHEKLYKMFLLES